MLFNPLTLWGLLSLSTSSAQAAPPSQPADARGSVALYCPDSCADLTLSGLGLATRLPRQINTPTVTVVDVTDSWQRPDQESLQAWGEGVVDGMPDAKQIILLQWAAPRDQAAATLAAVLSMAIGAGPWIEDVDTGRFLGTVAARGLAGDALQEAPDLTRLTTVELVDPGQAGAENLDQADEAPASQTVVLTTRGLARLGLPELIERNVARPEAQARAARINAIAQALFESGVVSRLSVDASRFLSATASAAACQLSGVASLSYDHGARDLPPGTLRASVDAFDGDFGDCPSAAPAPADAASTQIGAAVSSAAHPAAVPEAVASSAAAGVDSLATARAAALRELRGPVHQSWIGGLPDGDRLLIKAPFQTNDGRVEWLWVQVLEWSEEGQPSSSSFSGTVLSDPVIPTTVTQGSAVQCPLSLVFDYLWIHADGSRQGNQTQTWL